jgi:arylamine N-acetyltransferase
VQGIIAARAAPGERHALRNTRYTVHLPGGETRRRFLGQVDEFRTVLAERFHVRMPGGSEIDRRIAALIDANPPA